MIEIRLKKRDTHLDSFCAGLGLQDLVTDRGGLYALLRKAARDFDESLELDEDARGRARFEKSKYLGDGFGITVYGYTRERPDGGRVTVITGWQGFAVSAQENDIAGLSVERGCDSGLVAFCEDAVSGNAFEFLVNNKLDFLERLRTRHSPPEAVCPANFAMISSYGTIILPVVKDSAVNSGGDEERMALVKQARQGDEHAEELLREREQEMAAAIRERLKTEDMLSVFHSYLMPLFEGSGVFNVLGEISDVSHVVNESTGEQLVRLSLCAAGTCFDLFISAGCLLGMPSEGMRFMGMGMMQGRAYPA